MKTPNNSLEELIYYVDISMDSNTDLFRWKRPKTVVFPMDIIAARAEATEEFYWRAEKANLRSVSIKVNGIIFSLAAEEIVQYQLIEALIESIAASFFDTYGVISHFSLSGMGNLFDSFQKVIPTIFQKVQQERVAWVTVPCKLCKENHQVCINRAIIESAEEFPISIVYLHRGIGLCLYIDANLKVRGVEPVKITG